jgi:hypothetical protein
MASSSFVTFSSSVLAAEVAEVGEVKYGYSHPVVPVLPDLKTVTISLSPPGRLS